jgi:hypothetical protein
MRGVCWLFNPPGPRARSFTERCPAVLVLSRSSSLFWRLSCSSFLPPTCHMRVQKLARVVIVGFFYAELILFNWSSSFPLMIFCSSARVTIVELEPPGLLHQWTKQPYQCNLCAQIILMCVKWRIMPGETVQHLPLINCIVLSALFFLAGPTT